MKFSFWSTKILRKESSGFSIVELLTSMFIFFVAMIAMISFFISSTIAQRNILSGQVLRDNTNYALESMARQIRYVEPDANGNCTGASDRKYLVSGGSSITFEYPDGCITYRLTGGKIEMRPTSSSSYREVTSSDITVTSLNFELIGDGVTAKERVKIVIQAESADVKSQEKVNIRLQATVSNRNSSPTPPPGPPPPPPPPDPSLVAYWQLDESSGTTAADSTGNGHTGTLTNMDPSSDWVAGKVGGGLDFDGSNDFVVVGDAASLRGNQDLTIALWFNASSLATYQKLITKGSSSSSKDWELGVGTAGNVNWESEVGGSGYILDSPNGLVSTGTWHHIAVVLDKTNNTLRLYLDGSQVAEDTTFGNNSDSTTAIVNIGRRSYSANLYFRGIIDEVRVYNRALSAAEISSLP